MRDGGQGGTGERGDAIWTRGNGFFSLVPVRGRAEVRDVLHAPPAQHAEVAFMLKVIPCLEQLDKGAGRLLLDTVRADILLVSFPVLTRGGE